MSADRKVFVFGNNREGQLGVSHGDDVSLSPVEINHLEASTIFKISLNQNQTFLLQDNGVLLSAGLNDNNELGRSGKRSMLHRVDALETFQMCEAALGSGFSNLLCDDGKVVSWGVNDMGQLGNGTRDNKGKPRVNSTIQEPLLQIASGATHTIALTKSGRVVTWGGNRWGQLGDGQLTSSTKIHVPLQLRHRPVVSVACGENHSLVMTIGGNVYGWGENTQGQLGLSDTTNRLRPEQIKALRSMGATKIAAGRNHSLVISQKGLLLAFGSNNHGQCGVDSEVKVQPQPIVVERLRELRTVDVCGGFAHTLALCEVPGKALSRVYVMGLNSSGQLGLGTTANQSTPTLLPLGPGDNPIGIATGPMAMHSFVLTRRSEGSGAGDRVLNPMCQQALPSVHLDKVATVVQLFKDCHRVSSSQTASAFVKVREMISGAFASIPVLNASFLLPADKIGHGSLCVDLKAVRSAYDLIMSTEALDPLGVVTLGRATLHLADQLKECPVDDAENLSVFLIVLENPLMLRPSSFHVAIELVIRGILSIPKYYRLILFKWLKSYPSEYFSRVLQVLQGFLSLILTNKSLNLDPTPVILVLETLYQCNAEEKIVPENLFYNDAVPRTVNLQKEWIQFRSQSFDNNVFNYCSYPFLIHEFHKLKLLRFEFKNLQDIQVAVSHRNLPIARYLQDRVALLATAGRALQILPAAPGTGGTSSAEGGAHAAAPSSTVDSSGLAYTSTSSPSTDTPQVTPPASVPPAAHHGAPAPRAAPQAADNLHFLSSARVDTIIEQAVPLLPPGAETQGTQLPAGVNISYDIFEGVVSNMQLWLELSVTRNRLLPDLIEKLDAILDSDPHTLFLPLKVSFKGEIGVDFGGIKREFFTIAIKEIITKTNLLGTCASGRMVWFTGLASGVSAANPDSPGSPVGTTSGGVPSSDAAASRSHKQARHSDSDGSVGPALAAASSGSTKANTAKYEQLTLARPLAYYLGLLVGLAAYNEVHVDVPLPRCIYKTIKGEQLTLMDLWGADSALASGLQALLDFEEGTGCIEEVFGVTFTASANPLLGFVQSAARYSSALSRQASVASDGALSRQVSVASEGGSAESAKVKTGSHPTQTAAYVELIPGGAQMAVGRSNRLQFVNSFVRHALHGSVAGDIEQFVRGLKTCFHAAALDMCSALEIEHILCGSKEIGDLSELRLGTTYKGSYTDESPIVQWFWDMLSALSLGDKRKFLHFVTGSERVPLGGLSKLKMTVQSISQGETALPTSHTCFNILNIPDSYSSAAQLNNRFALALQHHEGFGLV